MQSARSTDVSRLRETALSMKLTGEDSIIATKSSNLQRYASNLLKKDVIAYIKERRSRGESFRGISSAIFVDTGGMLSVSDVTVGKWAGEE